MADYKPAAAHELAKEMFPDDLRSEIVTGAALREAFVLGYEVAEKTSKNEITELKTRLLKVLTRLTEVLTHVHQVITLLDSHSWRKNDQMFVEDIRRTAIGHSQTRKRAVDLASWRWF